MSRHVLVVLAVLLAGCSSNDHGESSPDRGLDECRTPDGGLPCDPTEVVCGSIVCTTPDEFCCISADAGPPACLDVSASCPAPVAELYCDEAADCASGQVCCATVRSGFPVQYCASSCSGPSSVQVCRTTSECTNGQPCVTQSCKGAFFETCGHMPVGTGCEPG